LQNSKHRRGYVLPLVRLNCDEVGATVCIGQGCDYADLIPRRKRIQRTAGKKGKALVRAPCPGLLSCLLFRLLSLTIIGPEFDNLRMCQVEDLRGQKQITLIETV